MQSLWKTLGIIGLCYINLVCLPATASAEQALLWTDNIKGTSNTFDKALTQLSISTRITNTKSAFIEALDNETWSFVVVDMQADSYSDVHSHVVNYIANGGRVISYDWYPVSSYADAFGISKTSSTNDATITLTDTRLSSDITGPISLFNPGWGVYSYGIQPLTNATSLATYSNGDSAIVLANDGRTIFNSFADDTFDSSSEAARVKLAENEINIVLDPPAAPVPEASTLQLLAGLCGMSGLGLSRLQRKMRKP